MLVEDLYTLLKYALLGMIQGFTEPIPISSSGHLVVIQEMTGVIIEGMSFEVLVNFASLIAVLIIYRRDLFMIINNGLVYIIKREPGAKSDFNFIVYLIIGTIPAGVLGLIFGDFIGETLKGTVVVGISLLITGVALWLIRNLKGRKNDGNLTVKDAIIVGFAQALALLPGISRSGATIVAAMGLGMKQETALRFSFLLYIPISVGTGILGISDIINDPQINVLWIPYAIAFLLALVFSYYSLRWFMGIMQKGNLKYFSYYCFIAGTLILVYL